MTAKSRDNTVILRVASPLAVRLIGERWADMLWKTHDEQEDFRVSGDALLSNSSGLALSLYSVLESRDGSTLRFLEVTVTYILLVRHSYTVMQG